MFLCVAYGVNFPRKKFFDSTDNTKPLYYSAHPKYLAETILPPPPLRVSAESVQRMHQDRCRCIQVHTLRLPTLSRPCLCFWTLPYSEYIYYIIAYKKSQAPERSQCLTRDLSMIHLKGRCFMPPSAGLSNFNGRPPRLLPLSLLQKFCFREPLRKTLTDSFFGYLSYFSGTQVHTEPAMCLTHM